MKRILLLLLFIPFIHINAFAATGTVTISFNGNGADNANEWKKGNTTVTDTDSGKLQNNIFWYKKGYILSSWNTKADGSGKKYTFRYNDPNKYTNKDFDSNNVTLYAQYTPAYTRIRYDGNGATSGEMYDEFISVDKTYTIKDNNYTKTGYTFDGWEIDGKKVESTINTYNATMQPKQERVFVSGLEEGMWYGQGGTIFEDNGKKYLLASYVPTSSNTTNKDGDSWLYVYDFDTGAIVRKKAFTNLGHVNDISWNYDDKFFITTTKRKINYNLEEIGSFSLKNSDETSIGGLSAIAYRNEKYYALNATKFNVYDRNFKLLEEHSNNGYIPLDFNSKGAFEGQGAGATDNYIYNHMFIGSACNSYVMIRPINRFGEVGEEILRNVDNPTTGTNWAKGQWKTTSFGDGKGELTNVTSAVKGYKITRNTTGNKDWGQFAIPLKKGETYTASGYVRVPSGGTATAHFRIWDGEAGDASFNKKWTVSGTSWQKYSFTFTHTGSDDSRYLVGLSEAGDIEYYGMSLRQDKVYFFNHLSGNISSYKQRRELQDMYYDAKENKTYYITDPSSGAGTDGNTYLQIHDGDAIPTTIIKARWKINTYTVKFTDGQGNVVKTEKVEYGKPATAPTITREGYKLIGWNQSFSKITKNITVNAKWEPLIKTGWYSISPSTNLTYRLESDKYATILKTASNLSGQKYYMQLLSDGTYKIGTGSSVGTSVLEGDLSVKRWSNTTVQRWIVVQNGTNFTLKNKSTGKFLSFSGNTLSINTTASLWRIQSYSDKYTITFTDGYGKTLKRESVKKGNAATAPSAPKITGKTFIGWSVDFSNITSNLTVDATYK